MIIFAIILVYSGYGMAAENTMQVSAALGLPKNIVYMVMPISGVIIIVYAIRNIYRDIIKKFKKGEEK